MLLSVNRILMLTSEAAPYAKSGGLADVVTALSQALAQTGSDVRVLMPRYDSIDSTGLELSGELSVPLGMFPSENCRLYHAPQTEDQVEGKVNFYFLDHPWFHRDGIYGNREIPFFTDNFRRFALLNNALEGFCRHLDWYPRILHAHDWPGAVSVGLLKDLQAKEEFRGTRSVFSIHNIGYQGIFSPQDIHYTALSWDTFQAPGLNDRKMNLMASAISLADRLTTVSPSHAREICHPRYSFGLHHLIKKRRRRLTGILNGADYTVWDPGRDGYLPKRYTSETLVHKRTARTALLQKLEIATDINLPIMAMITRITAQKGFPELLKGSPGLFEELIAKRQFIFIVLGTGDNEIMEQLQELSRKYRNFYFKGHFSEETAHLIEGGADFFFMPSLYEPCGLNQLYSMRYGTIPVVRKTGGLKDTVHPIKGKTGSGFVFKNYTARELLPLFDTIYNMHISQREYLDDIRRRIMGYSFDWKESARRYQKVYDSCFK